MTLTITLTILSCFFFVFSWLLAFSEAEKKKNLIKMWKKNLKIESSFALSILNEAECLLCAQTTRKNCKYSLKRHYTTYHTKLHSIMSSKESALAT